MTTIDTPHVHWRLTRTTGEIRELPRATPRQHIVHLPTPGDHYSPATGSAVMTAIHGFNTQHISRGLPATVLVSRGTTEGYPPYDAGDTREIDLPVPLTALPFKAADHLFAKLARRRPFAAAAYARVPDALGKSFAGTLIVHNAPAAIPMLREKLPHAFIALHLHNQLFNRASHGEVRRVLDAADAILCVSNFIARDFFVRTKLHAHTAPAKKIKTVYNGVDTNAFYPLEGAGPADREPPVILFVGRVLPEKGPDLLIKAAARLADRPFTLRIMGSSNFNAMDPLTPYERTLRDLARPLGDRIEFVPFTARHRLPYEYRRATIFVAPSNWDEPFGMTITEALASGLPCVLSRRGGITEVAGDAALYFMPPNDAELAAQIARLLDKPAVRSVLQSEARERAQHFAWPARYQSLAAALQINPATTHAQ